MQLKKITKKLGIASCALLQVPAIAVNASDSEEWDIDTAFLYYSESDSRVSAFEPAVYMGKNLGDDGERIDLRLVVDVLTGATPTGAHSSSEVQTFTTPSGNSNYEVKPGEIPLDDSFMDTRVAGGADWTLPINRMARVKLGVNASKEYDYMSLGVSGTYIQDLNNKNTTLSAGMAFNNDILEPEGGIPIAFSPMMVAGKTPNRTGSDDSKTITDFIFGVTQVVSRKTLIELNYSFGISDGYLSDPFKIISIVNDNGDLVTGADSAFFDTDVTGNRPYVYEKRPDTRQRNSLFFRTAHHLTKDVIHFSYRYFWDDWGINSNTFDLKYRFEMGRGYLQPHLRYYMQDEADFYRHNLELGADVDAATGAVTVADGEASSDSRLAKFTTSTVGLKYGYALGKNSELSIRGEFMSQSFDDDSNVSAIEETPDLDAVILNVGYSLRW